MKSSKKQFRNSKLLIYGSLVTFLLQSQVALGQMFDYLEGEKLCNVSCEGRPHTLCKSISLPNCDKYSQYNIFEIESLSYGSWLTLLINGHNGLRDRVARKANIANMVKMYWDQDLADMAIAYFKQCKPDLPDPCTQFKIGVINTYEAAEYKQDLNESYKCIVQNQYRVKAKYLPTTLIQSALRTWYNQKAKPFVTPFADYLAAAIINENDFVHMAQPLVSNFGCSIAQIDEYFHLVCNYYPFYRTTPYFITVFVVGPTASFCPEEYPVRDLYFKHLCCDGDEYQINVSSKIMPPLSCYILLGIAEVARLLTFYSHTKIY